MIIDQNKAFIYLQELAGEYANLKTKHKTWNELINLFAGANGKDRIEASDNATKEFNQFKEKYMQYKSICALKPDEEELIKGAEAYESPYIVGLVYQEFMSSE